MNQLFCYILYFSSAFVYSQVNFTHYNTDNGLPHDFTYQIHQDDYGFIWVGTDDGLAKFNGTHFKVLDRSNGFRSNFILDIKKYSEDTLAIATWKGGLHLMKKDSIIIPQIKDDNKEKIHTIYVLGDDILSFNFTNYFFYKKELGINFEKNQLNIVIDSLRKMSLQKTFNIDSHTSYGIPNIIHDSLYFYRGVYSKSQKTYLKGIYKYISREKIVPVFPFFKDKYVNDFGEYGTNMFYATVKDHFYVFNHDRIIKEEKYPFNNNFIHRFAETKYCKVFIVRDETRDDIYEDASGNDRIFVYNKKKETWKDILDLANSKILVSDIFVDKNENIWITSKADGLYKLSEDKSIFSEIVLDQEHIIDIAASDEGVVFFLTINKVYGYEYRTKKLFMHLLKDIEAYKFQQNIIEDQNASIYFNGVLKDKTLKFLTHEIVKNDSIFRKEKELSIYNNSLYLSYFNKKRNLLLEANIQDHNNSATINDIEIVEDNLWIGTNVGIMIYDLDSLEYLKTFRSGLGVVKENIQKIIYNPDQGVWIHTLNGLALINKENTITYYKEKNGLESDKINDIFIDHHGILWIATQKGFSIFNNEMFYNFNKRDGLPSSFVSKIIEDKNHQIWVSGNKGVVRIDNTKSFEPIIPPKLLVNKINNRFEVDDIIDYSGKKITTQYRTNLIEEWKPFESHILDVNNYAIGDYNIQFRSRNPSSNWVYSKEYPFSIHQIWFKQVWFILCISIFTITCITSFVLFRLRLVKKRNKLLQDTIAQSIRLEKKLNTVRENVAQDFHDELGNKLAGITVMSELMIKDEELQQSKSADMILQVRKDAKDLYFGIKDFVWSIDSKSDDLKELMIYLTDFGEELFQNKGIIFKVKTHPNTIKLPYYWSRQLLLMFKEVMTNSLKHSDATKTVLEFGIRENNLTVIFSDNGKGFNINKIKRKNGLININKRAARIGGKIQIDSFKGTKITFTGKFK